MIGRDEEVDKFIIHLIEEGKMIQDDEGLKYNESGDGKIYLNVYKRRLFVVDPKVLGEMAEDYRNCIQTTV